MNRGFIKIYRKIQDNPVYQDSKLFLVFTEFLFRAALDQKWVKATKGEIQLERGQCFFGIGEMAVKRQLSPQQIRSSIRRLENMGIIKANRTKKGTIVTIVNFDIYNPTSPKRSTEQANKKQGVFDKMQHTNNKQTVPATYTEAEPYETKEHTPNTHPTHTQHIPNTYATPKKKLRSKEVKKREGKVFDFTPPTLQDVLIQGTEINCHENICIKFFEYYQAGNWADLNNSNSPTWQQKLITWRNTEKTKNIGHKTNNPEILTAEDYTNDF